MNKLSNQMLIETYQKAIHLRIDSDFINLLREELKKRGICLRS